MATEAPVNNAVKVPLSDVRVWTPSGEEIWSGSVYAAKAQRDGNTVTSYSQPEAVGYAKQAGGFVPSSGLWYQSREKLQSENPDVEKDFVTGVLEDTATLWKYLKIETGKNFADGLLIQYPFLSPDGKDLLRDEKGIPKGKQIWQMALPVDSGYVHDMPDELATFANTLFGMEGAIESLPDYAYLWSNPDRITPGAERRTLRGAWRWGGRGGGRVDVDGHLAPSGRGSDVGFRVFEGGEDTIKDVDARRRKLVVEARNMEEAERYASALRGHNVPFVEE